MLASIALPLLFLGSGALALGSLIGAWRTWGGQWRAIQAQLAALDEARPYRAQVTLIEMRAVLPVARRSVFRPQGATRLRPRPAQRAAA